MPENNDNEKFIVRIPQTHYNLWFEALDETNERWSITIANVSTTKKEILFDDVSRKNVLWILADMVNENHKKYRKISKTELKNRLKTKLEKLKELNN